MNSTLETLRQIFPLVVADIIFKYIICLHKKEFTKQLTIAFSQNNINKILNIKSSKLSLWLINFEKVNIENYLNTSKNIKNFEKQRAQILIDNHLSIKKWRERQKHRQKELQR